MKRSDKEKLFEMMGMLDSTFKSNLNEDSPFPVRGRNKYIDNHKRYGGKLAAIEIDLIIDYLNFLIQENDYEESDFEYKNYKNYINQLEIISNYLM